VNEVRVVSARGTLVASRAFFRTTGVLPRAEARSVVRELYGEPDRPTLIALYALALGVEPYMPERVRDAEFLTVIDSAIDSGQLVLTDEWASDGRSRGGPELEDSAAARVAKAVMDGHDEIVFEGRRYRIVAEGVASRWESREGYLLVDPTLAADLVERMAQKLAQTPDQRTRWAEAVMMVGDPSEGRGLSLLRHAPGGGAADDGDDDDDSVTPSQLKPKIADTHWIEIAIAYDDGTPFEGNCAVALPDGRHADGPPGDGGIVRVDGLTAGTCQVQLPDLDADSFKLA